MHVFYISIFIVFVVCFWLLIFNGGLFIFNIKLCFVCYNIVLFLCLLLLF